MTNVLYICSAGHSGSTLLDLLLGSHSRAASLGEITHFPKNLALDTDCACGAPISACALWQKVIGELEAGGKYANLRANPYQLNLGFIEASNVIDLNHQTKGRMALRKLLYGLSVAHLQANHSLLRPAFAHLQGLARNKMEFLDVVAEVAQVDQLVDSSKHYLEAVALYKTFPEKVRIIELVRDGRAVFYSGLKRKVAPQASLDAWKNTYLRAMPILKNHVPVQHKLRVHYEELTRTPIETLKTICEFAGLPYEAAMTNFQSHEHHMTNGNRMRFSSDSEIRFDESWKRDMSAADLAFFNEQAKELNDALGYR